MLSPEQRCSPQAARRDLARLVDEHGADALLYSTVRDYVRLRRPEIDQRRRTDVFVPQEHAPGAEVEVDFGEVYVVLAGVKTKCYMFVIELKTGRFEPAFTGQLGFYVAVIDDRMRRDFHRPTAGILICGGHNEHTVRHALSQTGSPRAVSSYTYESLPPAEQAALPTAKPISAALDWTADRN